MFNERILVMPGTKNQTKKKVVEKQLFYGAYGNARANWLKKNKPKLYKALEKSGELYDYLDGYQKAYVVRSNELTEQLEKKYKVTPWLRQNNYLRYAELCFQIQQKVRDEIMKRIMFDP